MALSNAFKKAVEDNSVRKIRIMLKDSLLVDPSFGRFNEMIQAASSVEGLYDEHNGKELVENQSEWDNAYMDRLMVQVVDNFSHERLEHLKKVVRYLVPVSPKKDSRAGNETGGSSTTTFNGSPYQKQKREDQKFGDYRKIAGGVVGGFAGAGVGTLFSMSGVALVSVVVVGAVAGGAVATTLTERK